MGGKGSARKKMKKYAKGNTSPVKKNPKSNNIQSSSSSTIDNNLSKLKDTVLKLTKKHTNLTRKVDSLSSCILCREFCESQRYCQ